MGQLSRHIVMRIGLFVIPDSVLAKGIGMVGGDAIYVRKDRKDGRRMKDALRGCCDESVARKAEAEMLHPLFLVSLVETK